MNKRLARKIAKRIVYFQIFQLLGTLTDADYEGLGVELKEGEWGIVEDQLSDLMLKFKEEGFGREKGKKEVTA